ncbi:MAG: hypothetical protein ACYTFA_17105 [Planctomycetota bacterium]|jgi:hypothetical protein
MKQFDDARKLTGHLQGRVETLRRLHTECLAEKTVKTEFVMEVKHFVHDLDSALQYCARALFARHGPSNKPKAKIYFPYATPSVDKIKFRDQIVQGAIPGLLTTRPDIVDMLETYQHFGNTGNWLYLFMQIANEHKHDELTPQVAKEYTAVTITGTVAPGERVKIDLANIQLGGGPDKPFHAVAGKWTGLEFTGTGALVMPHLEHALQNVVRIVEELSAA